MVYNRTGWPLGDYQIGVQFIPNTCEPDIYETPVNNNDWSTATPIPLRLSALEPGDGARDPRSL